MRVIEKMASEYRGGTVETMSDTFVLYRIIGNDLPPRHAKGQSRENLTFILENEPEHPACEKRFVVNRIVNPDEERAVLELLEKARAGYIHIPFDSGEYRRLQWDVEGVPVEYAPWTKRFMHLTDDNQGQVLMRLYSHKNQYVMNNNGARNAALREGRAIAKWVLPWDGNCFVTASAWREITAAVAAEPEVPYFIVPMARMADNDRLFEGDFRPDAGEEPQIAFRCDTSIEFDESYHYGRRPKVEMLWRLGVAGNWDDWSITPWDRPCPAYARDAGAYRAAGWVARLSSGKAHLEGQSDGGQAIPTGTAIRERGFARVEAIKRLLDQLDDTTVCPPPGLDRTISIRSLSDQGSRTGGLHVVDRLREVADEALSRGPYSVVDKVTLPPSGNRHDYWHPAPYYWPHPLRIPGLPYVRRDGKRVPGTRLYEMLSEKYDRTRLQRLFDDTFVLALAWHSYREDRYGRHAAMLVRTWFLAPQTAMNPHLEYAQVRWGHNANTGSSSGIIEMKDLYYFLDAVKLLIGAGWLSAVDRAGLEDWFARYLHWIQSSTQGCEERAERENHGTYYDLQMLAIAAFLGDQRLARETLRDSRSRILQQVSTNGMQPQEMRRTNTAHYCCFNLQGWIHIAQVAEQYGEDLWTFQGSDGRGIRRAMEWMLPHIGRAWPYPQTEPFDSERLYPIYHVCRARYGEPAGVDGAYVPSLDEIKPLFHPHDGIMPFWQWGSVLGEVHRGRFHNEASDDH